MAHVAGPLTASVVSPGVVSGLDAGVRIFHNGRIMGTAVAEIDSKEVLAFPVGPVAVFCWHDRPTIASLQTSQDFFIAHYQGRDMVMLSIVESTAAPPEAAERAHIHATMHRFGPKLHATAAIIEGEGFKAAAVRAVMAGISMAVRMPYPIRFFATVAEATPWLLDRVPGSGFSSSQVLQAVERRRQAWRTSSSLSLGR